MRCESVMTGATDDEQLLAIHREIGLAGYETCSDFDFQLRRDCIGLAAARVIGDSECCSSPLDNARLGAGDMDDPPFDFGRTLATMFSETIAASDALAAELADRDVEEEDRDRLHLVHAHVMSACELLDERLTVLELEGPNRLT